MSEGQKGSLFNDESCEGNAVVNTSHNPIIRAWTWWFTPRSTDPTVVFRERALRMLLPIFLLLRPLSILRYYQGDPNLFTPSAPLWINLAFFFIPIFFSFYFLARHKVDLSGTLFILHWYFADLISLQTEGYWYPGYQISLIMQIIFGTLLLPSRSIVLFLIFQIVTVGIWGNWLDVNFYDPPLLSTGESVAVFRTALLTLAAQEAIIVFAIRYLRMQMEKSLRLQQTTITQLEGEIAERKRMELERKNFIRELNGKNAELERFTYTVSHDLKSPLVTIKGFLGILKKDLKENNHNHIQKDFERIAEAADKMGILLSELLELSRIGRVTNPPEEVDLAKLTQDALETLDGRIRERNVTVTISPDLPIVYADRNRLREVLENLIDNAAKYMGDQPQPQIEIGKRESGTETILYIKDNGIGIEPQFHAKIFGLFEKLNAHSEGSGIGLALIKRIIEVHGGRIWVESEGLGKGSTFCFTIPDKRG